MHRHLLFIYRLSGLLVLWGYRISTRCTAPSVPRIYRNLQSAPLCFFYPKKVAGTSEGKSSLKENSPKHTSSSGPRFYRSLESLVLVLTDKQILIIYLLVPCICILYITNYWWILVALCATDWCIFHGTCHGCQHNNYPSLLILPLEKDKSYSFPNSQQSTFMKCPQEQIYYLILYSQGNSFWYDKALHITFTNVIPISQLIHPRIQTLGSPV